MSNSPTQIVLSSIDEAALGKLREAARESAARAYAPYSKFQVGAAVLDEHDRIHSGCNVENASYGLAICAERNAVFAAIAAGARALRGVAVFTLTETLTPPCGACRQVLSEFDAARALEVHLFNGDGSHEAYKLCDLIPLAFKL